MIELSRVNKDFCGKTLLNFRIIPMFALTLLEIDSICFLPVELVVNDNTKKICAFNTFNNFIVYFKSTFLKICLNLRIKKKKIKYHIFRSGSIKLVICYLETIE